MDMFLQQLVNALSLGGTYALLALGLAVVFSIMGLINFAHGELMTATGYGLCFALLFGMPFGLAVVAALAVGIALVLLMERTAFRPVRGASGTTLLLTSFAVSAILRVLFQNFISARPQPVPMPMSLSGTLEIGGLHIGVIQAISILVTVIMLAGLNLFLRTTVLGRAMRAAAEDFAIVRLMGIRANAVVATAFAISGLLAGVAGVLWVAQRGSVDPAAPLVHRPAEQQVLVHRQRREDTSAFRRQRHAHAHDHFRRQRRYVPAGEGHAPRPLGRKADERIERRALARAVRTEQGDDLAASNLEVDALQRLDGPIGNLEAADLEHGGLVGNVTRHQADPRGGSFAPANSRKIALRPKPEGIA